MTPNLSCQWRNEIEDNFQFSDANNPIKITLCNQSEIVLWFQSRWHRSSVKCSAKTCNNPDADYGGKKPFQHLYLKHFAKRNFVQVFSLLSRQRPWILFAALPLTKLKLKAMNFDDIKNIGINWLVSFDFKWNWIRTRYSQTHMAHNQVVNFLSKFTRYHQNPPTWKLKAFISTEKH